jgi:hypothetical protein
MVTVLVKILRLMMSIVLVTKPKMAMVTAMAIGVVSGHRFRGWAEGVMGIQSGFVGL